MWVFNGAWSICSYACTPHSCGGLRELLKFSLIVVASVPVLMMYPFVQKYFVRGVMIGSIKG